MQRDKHGGFVKNSSPWNKGKKGVYSQDILAAMSKAKRGKHISLETEFKKGHVAWNKGMKGLNLSHGKGWFSKGHTWSEEIENKRLKNLKEKILINPKWDDEETLAYVLGVLKGDGCVYKHARSYRICLDVTDKNFSLTFYKALRKIGLNPFIKERMPTNGVGRLKKHIVIAHSKLFGEWYKNISISELEKILNVNGKIISFLSGFYESEGQIYRHKSGSISLYIHNTDLNLLTLVQQLSAKLNLNFKIYGPYKNTNQLSKNKKSLYILSMHSTENCSKFLQLIRPSIKL